MDFVFGFVQMVHLPRNNLDSKVMFNILGDMMADAMDYSWQNARNFYAVAACFVEMERLEWTDAEGIAKLRRQYAQKHSPPGFNRNSDRAAPVKTCNALQRGQCPVLREHDGLKYACSFCVRVTSKTYPHMESECIRKSKQAKNDHAGEI